MTRINTNISSMTAQKTLGQNNSDMQTALTRLTYRFANQLRQGRSGRFDC